MWLRLSGLHAFASLSRRGILRGRNNIYSRFRYQSAGRNRSDPEGWDPGNNRYNNRCQRAQDNCSRD